MRMLRAIWPQYRNLPNSTPPTAGTITRDYLSFFLFCFCSLPAIWFPVHKIRHLFTVKAYFVPTAGLVFFIGAMVKARGIGPNVQQQGKAHGSALAWGIIKGIMSSIANFATLIVNDPDFARFTRRPRDAFWSQLTTISVGFAVTSFISIVVSSSSTIYKEPIWNPLDLLSNFLNGASPVERLGVFIVAAAFTLAQLGTNIAANSVSAGTDRTALLPRYLNIRQGGYICARFGLVMCCSWNPLSTSNNFTTYLSAYSVFLSSIAGVIIADYYLVRRGCLQIKDLYRARSGGSYHFTRGFHWRGYTAYLAGILINIVGFVGVIGRQVPIEAHGTYWALCRLSPILATSDVWMGVGEEIQNVSVADTDNERPEVSSLDAESQSGSQNDNSSKKRVVVDY